jgi:hypothetical protein
MLPITPSGPRSLVRKTEATEIAPPWKFRVQVNIGSDQIQLEENIPLVRYGF